MVYDATNPEHVKKYMNRIKSITVNGKEVIDDCIRFDPDEGWADVVTLISENGSSEISKDGEIRLIGVVDFRMDE